MDDFSRKSQPSRQPRRLEYPEDMLLAEHSRDVLAAWKAPEFEVYEKDKRWYVTIFILLAAIVTYAIFSNSSIMAITFILIGVVGYIYIGKEPRILDFTITTKGITAGKELYPFENIRSFWIFYEAKGYKAISLHGSGHLLPHIHVPIDNQNPAQIRKILLKYLPEEKQEDGMAEAMERFLHL